MERSKRQGRSCTEPRDPLEARRIAQQQRQAERAEVKREREAAEAESLAREAQVRKECARVQQPVHRTTRQTYSTYLKAQSVREKQKAARAKSELEQEVARERALRQRGVAKKMAEELRHTDREREERLLDSSAPKAAAARLEFKKKLKENKKKMADFANKAPSLISRLNIQTARDKARVAALKRVSQAVYGTTKPSDWRSAVSGADIFDEQDKIFLQISDANDDDDLGI